jgi:hypothetical protein
MIVFDLRCHMDHVFEAWFRDSRDFERQSRQGLIACPVCGDARVVKAPMAPNVATRKGRDEETLPEAQKRTAAAFAYMQAVREHVTKNFDHVGDKFAEEARKIHYGETDKRNIYGRATKGEAKELRDEGIEFGELPFPIVQETQ